MTLGYFAVAEVSLALTTPLGYATPVWPAAGLALGALLAWGPRCWPAVWVGSFAANIVHQAVISGADMTPATVALAAMIGAGASLQAVVGERLVRPLIQENEPLWKLREAMRLLLLGGPLACLVSATVGVAGLHLLQGEAAEAVAAHWVIWWAGDSLGVLLFGPLILLILPAPSARGRGTVLSLLVPLLVTGALVVAGYAWHSASEQAAHRHIFDDRVENFRSNLKNLLARYIGGVLTLAAVFDASEDVTQTEFEAFSPSALAWSNLELLAWMPRVPRAERSSVEATARSDGQRNFVFRERRGNERLLVTAGEREEYYPARYIAARSGGDAAMLGFDASAKAESRAILQRAIDSALPILAEREVLYRVDTSLTNSRELFIALYRPGFDAQAASVEARREALRGFAAGLFRLDRTLALAAAHNGRQALPFRLLNQSDPDFPRLVQESAVPDVRTTRPDASRRIEELPGISMLLEVWDPAPWQSGGTASSKAYLIGSVFVTLLAAVFSLASAARSARVAGEVARRTAELRKSEQRTRSILDNTSALIAELTPDGVLVDINRAGLTACGQRRDDVIGKPFEKPYCFSHSATQQAGLRGAIRRARMGETVRYDAEWRIGEDRFITVDWTLAAVHDSRGRVANLIASGIDITARKQGESEIRKLNENLERIVNERTASLRRIEQRFSNLFNHSPDAVLMVDEQGHIILASRQVQVLFGYSQEELIGQELEILVPASQRAHHVGLRDRFVKRPSVRSMGVGQSLVAVRKDGSQFPVDICLSYMESGDGIEVVASVRDISQRVGLEAESRRQHELLQKIVDNIPVMIAYVGPDGAIQWANRHWHTVLGWSLEDTKRPDILSRIYPDPSERDSVMRFISTASGMWADFQPRTKDGRTLDNLWANLLLSDGTSIGFGLDRSELKQSEERFRMLLESAPDAVVISDGDGRIVLVNAQTETLFGYARTELIGEGLEKLLPQRYRDKHAQYRKRYFVEPNARPMGKGLELFGLRKDGGEFQVEISLSPLQTADGMLISSAIRDVTEREEVARALREYRNLLSHAQSLAHLGYFSWDLVNDEMTWSDELFRIYGCNAKDHRADYDSYLRCTHPEDRAAVRQTLESSLTAASPFKFENRIVRPSGEVRHLISFGDATQDSSGRVIRLFGACLDVTEQKHTEAALHESAGQLRELSQSLVDAQEIERRRLAADLHDRVGQNLTALSINLAIVSERLKGADEDVMRRLQDSATLLESTTACVEGVLDELRPAMLDDWGLDSVLRWYAGVFGRRTEIAVNVSSHGELRRLAPRCETALFRIAQEALNNVAKHARAHKVEIVLDWREDAMSLEVADDGVGLDPARRDPSRGLGMLTMSERAETVGGRMEVDSVPDGGARITVTVGY